MQTVKAEIAKLKIEKEENFVEELREINNLITDDKLKRCIELASEKGASSWLTALPLQSMGYTLNKQEFRDAICLRYGWRIPNTPSFCSCKLKNTHDHTLNCKLGGYVNMRHNKIRDFEATLLKEVCRDVKIEPMLMPLRMARKVQMIRRKPDWMCLQLEFGVQWRGPSSMSG